MLSLRSTKLYAAGPSGELLPVQVDATGKLTVTAVAGGTREFFADVALGLVPGYRTVNMAGHNLDIDIATVPEDVWEGGGLYPFQTTAQLLEILSSSANDTAAGTGLRTVEIDGLDASYSEISEVVTLNGIATVNLVNSYLRINRVRGRTVGSAGANAGVVTVRVQGGGAIQGVMDTGDGIAHQAIYTVPAGHSAIVVDALFDILRTANNQLELDVLTRVPGETWTLLRHFALDSQGTSSLPRALRLPFFLPEKSDIRITAGFVSANNTQGFGSLSMVLVEN